MSSGLLFGSDRLSLDSPQIHPVEVFCVGSHITGILNSIRPRVANHLDYSDQVIKIDDAALKVDPHALPFVEHQSIFINKPKVLFVLDMTPKEWADGGDDLARASDSREVFVSVGDFWISGQLELPVGGDLHDYLARSPQQFIPLTNATILDYAEREATTVLINRDHLEAVVARPRG